MGGTGTLAAHTEEHHQHHHKANRSADAQRPLNAEHVGSRIHGFFATERSPTQRSERLHQNNQHRGANRARNLTNRIRHRGSGAHLFRFQTVQRPCGDRHQHETHADLAHKLPNRHPPNPRGHGNQTHHDRAETQSNRADQRHRACAETVKHLTAEKLRNALAQSTRKHHQTANCSGIATAILNIQGHDHHNRTEREERKRGRDRANSKTTILQHTQIQQRRLRFRIFDLPASAMNLAEHKPNNSRDTNQHWQPNHRIYKRIRFNIRKAEH